MRSDYDPDGEPYDVARWRLLKRLRLAEQRAGHAERHAAELERCLQIMHPAPDDRPRLRVVADDTALGRNDDGDLQ
jgi:hypothetical protein